MIIQFENKMMITYVRIEQEKERLANEVHLDENEFSHEKKTTSFRD
jgi:hypothetical protein